MQRSILYVWLLTAAMGAAKDKAPTDALSHKLHQVIEEVEGAYAAGDIERVWRLMAPPVNGLSEDLAAKFDEALAAKKLPPARELMVEARLKLLMENRTAALPAPLLRERLLLLETLQDHVQNPLQKIASLPLMKEDTPPPKTMDEFDRRFHEILEVQGSLRLAETCAHYAKDLAQKLPVAARKKLTDKERETLAQSEGDLATKVQDAERDVRELELETRLLRLTYGVEVLQQKQLTKEKFIAAASTRQDARLLKQEMEPPVAPNPAKGAKTKSTAAKVPATPPAPVVFHRAALNALELPKEVAKLEHRMKEVASSLGDRAERFFMGLEFWLRGRYGWGLDLWGLAKSSAALEKAELLHQVYMPDNLLMPAETKEQPKPSIPGRRAETTPAGTREKRRPLPRCPDRRHHYTWAWEDRGLVSSTNEQKTVLQVPEQGYMTWVDNSGKDHSIVDMAQGTAHHYNFFGKGFAAQGRSWGPGTFKTHDAMYAVSVPPQDPRLVYRIVGFIEYAQAVQFLDTFVEEASEAELAVAEEIIRSQPAFRIDTNLSRRIETPGTLSEQSPNPRDEFRRDGLEWMLALARVELGAMLAGFTSHAEPFLSLVPTIHRKEREKAGPFGSAAYAELLLDGLRTHYWAIVREDVIADYYKAGVPENHLLTYGRRAILGRQFVRAVLQYGGAGNEDENVPPAHRTELQIWDQTFEKLQRIMLYCLTYKVGRQKTTLHDLDDSFKSQGRWLKIERDQTPDAIRRILLLVDPTLAGCGCK
jgi:hypothetical protein